MIDELIFKKIGIDVSRETFSILETYVSLLEKWQRAINLVGKSTLSDVYNRHFLDSAQLIPYIKKNNIADLGSGAGFPGMVIAILRKDWKVSLIESDIRKSEFLREVKRTCYVKNVSIINNRIESIEDEKYDCIVSRALSSIENILNLSKKIRNKGCEILLLKGENYKEEINILKNEKNNLIYTLYDSITEKKGKIIKIQEL